MCNKNTLLVIILVISILFTNSGNIFAASKSVAITIPPAPTLSYYPTTPTNGNVAVTIYYPNTAVLKQYRLGDNGIWTTYSVPVILSSNIYVYARYQVISGYWSNLGGYRINNIDKTPPSDPIFTASSLMPTNQNIVLTISYSQDSSTKLYKISNSSVWSSYTVPVVLSSNNVVYAKSKDLAGNLSNEASLTISNIDKTPPDAPTFTSSNTLPTKEDVIVCVNFSHDSTVKLYKLGNTGTWTDYTNSLIVSSNDIIFAKAQDACGNSTSEESYEVSNIDKTPPTDPVFIPSNTAATNQDISLTIEYSNESVIKQYKIGSYGLWTSYDFPINISLNDTVYAKACDNAENWTLETSYSVENIDKNPPENPNFTFSTTKLTDRPVAVTINFSQDSVLKLYKIDSDGAWLNYTTPLTLVKNCMVYAKSFDAVGNYSLETSCQISNIRKSVLGYTVKNYSTDVSSYNSITSNASALSEIATATYSVNGYGILTGAAPTDQINYSNSNNIRTKLMVGNNFDASIAKQLLESPTNRQTLKNNILQILKNYNYTGVDIDLENIPGTNRSQYTTLMAEIYNELNPLGYGVSVAVPGKTYDSPNATWSYAYDYKSLAMYSDFLMIMAYDEHYPGGTPGSIASINWVANIIDYALTEVPKEKIILGMAAYGYDWYGNTTKAYSISNCYNIAAQNGAQVNFDPVTKSKYFTYTVNGVSHTIWLEDGDTISYKLDLANSRDLRGVGIWRLGLENSNYWTTIKTKLNY